MEELVWSQVPSEQQKSEKSKVSLEENNLLKTYSVRPTLYRLSDPRVKTYQGLYVLSDILWCPQRLWTNESHSQRLVFNEHTLHSRRCITCFHTAVPKLPGTSNQFCGRQFLHGPGQVRVGWGGLGVILAYLLHTLFLLLIHQLHLRSSDTRSWRLESTALMVSPSYSSQQPREGVELSVLLYVRK